MPNKKTPPSNKPDQPDAISPDDPVADSLRKAFNSVLEEDLPDNLLNLIERLSEETDKHEK